MVKKYLTVIQAFLLFIFVLCAAYVGKYFYDAHKAQGGFDELKKTVEENREYDVSGNYTEARAENGMLKEYYELYKENNDLKGWIKIPDTSVDYPVVQSTDNEFYLRRNFFGEYQYSGIPFLDCHCGDESTSLLIYAHNMKSGAMFAPLTDYKEKSFCDEHKTILYDTLYEKGEYEIFAVFSTVAGKENEFRYYDYAGDDGKKGEYIQKLLEISMYDTGISVSEDDTLLTLSTCSYGEDNERFAVAAKKNK